MYENLHIIKAPKLREIAIDNDVTFYFEDSTEPFDLREFVLGTTTYELLSRIAQAIEEYNQNVGS
jgi:hypothetical protein